MWFPLYIAKRYLFSKKSYQAVNIISTIATISVAVGTMALVVILSVFNGFDNLIHTLYAKFNPDLLIQPISGKSFTLDSNLVKQLKQVEDVENFSFVLEDKALVVYEDKQTIAIIKGVSLNYNKVSQIESAIIQGSFVLKQNDNEFCILGQGIAYTLNINVSLPLYQQIEIYVPRKNANIISLNPELALNRKFITPSGIFSVEGDIDNQYIIVPLDFAQELFEYEKNKITSIELKIKNKYKTKAVQNKIKKLIGPDLIVKNRYEQNEVFYKTMKTEKIAIFLILFFILTISTFNVIGTLTMLILEKKEDIKILKSLGATHEDVKKIFFIEGILITLIGTLSGIILGLILCFLQIKFKLIKLYGSGTFIIDAYPVAVKFLDIILILLSVFILGIFTSYIPTRKLNLITKENKKIN